MSPAMSAIVNENWDMTDYNVERMSVYRVETTPSGNLIYIDQLCNDGVISIMAHKFNPEPSREVSVLRVVIRPVYETFDKALRASRRTKMPNDGVIAIRKIDSLTYRVKDPSLDLLCSEGGLWISNSDNTRSVVCDSMVGMEEGRVYECNLSADLNSITSWVLRNDKQKPNSWDVFETVMYPVLDDEVRNAMSRRLVTNVSFMMRKEVHCRAANYCNTGRLIVDIGCGRYQAGSCYDLSKYSYLLVDLKHDLQLATRIFRGSKVIEIGYNDKIVNALTMCNKYPGVVCLVSVDANVILPHIQTYLSVNSVPVMYMFSAQFFFSHDTRYLSEISVRMVVFLSLVAVIYTII